MAIVEDDDEILIDAVNNKLELLVAEDIIQKRLANWQQPKPNYTKGTLAKYAKLCKSAFIGRFYYIINNNGIIYIKL